MLQPGPVPTTIRGRFEGSVGTADCLAVLLWADWVRHGSSSSASPQSGINPSWSVEFEEMQPEEIRQVLLDILSRIVPDEDLSGLRDEVPFREQIELDSMDFLDIVMELRKQYRVQIPEDDYPHLTTMGGAVKYLTPLMKDVKAHA